MEPATGLEPATGSLQNCYATIASCRHTKMRVELLYDNNPDSQSLSHKRYNHQRQDIAGHVTRPHVRRRRWKNLPSISSCTFRRTTVPCLSLLMRAKAQMVLNSHRNRTVNRSCQTIASIWLCWFAARTRHPANAISLLEFHD